VVATMVRELAGASPAAVEYMRSSPTWQVRGAAAHTIPRQLGVDATYRGSIQGGSGILACRPAPWWRGRPSVYSSKY
jgi:hypothetical protein